MKLFLATTDAEIDACSAAMLTLRPHIRPGDFRATVRRMMKGGYHLLAVEDKGKVQAVGGFRLDEMLHRGYSMYIDDLSTLEGERSKGYGGAMIDWLIAYAKEKGCFQVHLDSGVQRFDAHRFYLRKRFNITSHHFALVLKPLE